MFVLYMLFALFIDFGRITFVEIKFFASVRFRLTTVVAVERIFLI